MMGKLYQQWQVLCDGLSISPAVAARMGEMLAARYGENGRFYHNLEHIRHVLTMLDLICAPAQPDPSLLLAAWFHDVVYDPRAGDNEAQSGTLAQHWLSLAGLPEPLVAEVVSLILLTQKHELAEGAARSRREEENGRFLLDADLAILAAEPVRYQQYAQAIRREYGFVTEVEYRRGRTAVLRHLLARHPLYYTPYMQAYNQQARHNIMTEISNLHPYPS